MLQFYNYFIKNWMLMEIERIRVLDIILSQSLEWRNIFV